MKLKNTITGNDGQIVTKLVLTTETCPTQTIMRYEVKENHETRINRAFDAMRQLYDASQITISK